MSEITLRNIIALHINVPYSIASFNNPPPLYLDWAQEVRIILRIVNWIMELFVGKNLSDTNYYSLRIYHIQYSSKSVTQSTQYHISGLFSPCLSTYCTVTVVGLHGFMPLTPNSDPTMCEPQQNSRFIRPGYISSLHLSSSGDMID